MLQELRAWLNGDREYFAGVVLFTKVSDNKALMQLFAKGRTEYCNQRLQEELLVICKQLKEQTDDSGKRTINTAAISSNSRNESGNNKERSSLEKIDGDVANQKLFDACKAEADKRYKEVMNLRAELFAHARADDYTDPNTPDRIEQRSKHAVQVAEDFKIVSALYDKADYVKLHGRLPCDGEPAGEDELNAAGLPEHLVKQTLDNLRKNVSKMKKRPATPERIALLQKHEENLKQLEERWRLLQPAK